MREKNLIDKNYHAIADSIHEFSKEDILSVYQKMTEVRFFEECIVKANNKCKFKIKVHMSTGQEAVSAAVGVAIPEYQVFVQHRSMDIYVALGGPVEQLRDEIMCLDSGCCGGKIGGAFSYHGNGRDIYTHTGLIGENISVGVGAALGNGRKTLCLFGDGAAEEDYALTSYGFAATHMLPVLFICEDNDLSVLSPVEKRRSWDLVNVARGFGLPAVDISDDPFTLMHWIREYETQLPALINVRTCRNYWHAGLGTDGPPKWDRYQSVSAALIAMGLDDEMKKINACAEEKMVSVWKQYL